MLGKYWSSTFFKFMDGAAGDVQKNNTNISQYGPNLLKVY